MTIDTIALWIKYNLPFIYRLIERMAEYYVSLRFLKSINFAKSKSLLTGTVASKPACIRALTINDEELLDKFFLQIPEGHLQYFHPHGFDKTTLRFILSSKLYITYGIFLNGQMIAYSLLKVSPSGAAYIGRLVAPEFTRLGLGRYLGKYLYWQAYLCGLRPRSTISKANIASVESHRVNKAFRVIATLPNNYLLIEFPLDACDSNAPMLNI